MKDFKLKVNHVYTITYNGKNEDIRYLNYISTRPLRPYLFSRPDNKYLIVYMSMRELLGYHIREKENE